MNESELEYRIKNADRILLIDKAGDPICNLNVGNITEFSFDIREDQDLLGPLNSFGVTYREGRFTISGTCKPEGFVEFYGQRDPEKDEVLKMIQGD